MKPCTWLLAVCALFGVLSAVGVSWILASKMIGPSTDVDLKNSEAAAMGWPVDNPPSADAPSLWSRSVWLGHDWTSAATHVTWDEMGGCSCPIDSLVDIERAGWPLRALRSTRVGRSPLQSEPEVGYTFLSWRFGVLHLRQTPGGRMVRYIPIDPIPVGLAVDSALYGLVLWVPLRGVGALRRALRVRAGLCARCAYPVGTSVVCTECGRPVKAKAVAA